MWVGLSPDLVIEHILMRNLKTAGCLTRGREMTEIQRLVWCLSRPACAEINSDIQQHTPVSYTTREQHRGMSQARQTRDTADVPSSFIEWRSQFDTNPSLRNITGNKVNGD